MFSLLGDCKLPLVPWLARGGQEFQGSLSVALRELVLQPDSEL